MRLLLNAESPSPLAAKGREFETPAERRVARSNSLINCSRNQLSYPVLPRLLAQQSEPSE